MTRMLRIGEFARLTGLPVRTLRFYDAVEVLRPAQVDLRTGYRLYALDQIQVAPGWSRFAGSGCGWTRSGRRWLPSPPSGRC